MGDKSKIEWTHASWNPIVGCEKVSPGCKYCYAIRDAHRMAGNPNPKIFSIYEGLTVLNGVPNWTGAVRFIEERLTQPLRWKRPRRIFVNSMSDLFHKEIPVEIIARIFAVMAACPQHTFQILTKRAERLFLLNDPDFKRMVFNEAGEFTHAYDGDWPLPNVWLGVSCENQPTADERIPCLLGAQAAVRWLSLEPLLGRIDLTEIRLPSEFSISIGGSAHINCLTTSDDDHFYNRHKAIDWVVVGGESGREARPMREDWVIQLRDQCVAASVPFFFKQWGRYVPRTHQEANDAFDSDSVWVSPSGEVEGTTFLIGDLCLWDYPEDNFVLMGDLGKKKAGRLLDGREWNEYPVKIDEN